MKTENNKFLMRLSGRINGFAISMRGSGVTLRDIGIVRGEYEAMIDSHGQDFSAPSHHLFSCLIITGYPSQTAPKCGNINPFVGAAHKYHRKVRFHSGELLNLDVRIEFDADGNIESDFHVEGTAPTTRLRCVLPTVETWIPVDMNSVSGEFEMTWLDEDGRELHAVACTLYEIQSPRCPLVNMQRREIKIQANGSLAAFDRLQVSRFI